MVGCALSSYIIYWCCVYITPQVILYQYSRVCTKQLHTGVLYICVEGVYKQLHIVLSGGQSRTEAQEERTGEQATGKGYSYRVREDHHRNHRVREDHHKIHRVRKDHHGIHKVREDHHRIHRVREDHHRIHRVREDHHRVREDHHRIHRVREDHVPS